MITMILSREVTELDARIEGEDEEYVKIYVTDNLGSEHDLTIEKEAGDIAYHQCEDYANKAKDRTPNENEHNEQVRRYAKYYLYQNRGYDAVKHTENPDYVNAVREAIGALSDEEFEEYFSPIYQQLQSHYDEATEQVVEIPAESQSDESLIYELDIYLEDNTTEFANQYGLKFDQESFQSVTDLTRQDLIGWKTADQPPIKRTDDDSATPEISAVSGIHVGYATAAGEHKTKRGTDPLEHEPDATIELPPEYLGDFDGFRVYLDHHLRCHVRDCFVGMGLVPPEQFQVIGFGTLDYAQRYDYYDLYLPFCDHEQRADGPFG